MSQQQQQQDSEGFPSGLIDEIMGQLSLWSRNHILFNWGSNFAQTRAQDPAIIEMVGTITTLNFHNYSEIDVAKFLSLSHLPFTSSFAHLNLSKSRIGQQPKLVNFLSHPILQHLVTLNLSQAHLQSLDALFIDTPHNFPNLRELHLAKNNLIEMPTLINPNKFPQLKALNLGWVETGTSILTALFSPLQQELPQMSTTTATDTPFRLEKLWLCGLYCKSRLPIELFSSPWFSQLKGLSLRSFTIYKPDINTLFGDDNGQMQHLTFLDLGGSTFKSDAFKALTQSPSLSNLNTLVLNGSGLTAPSSSPALEVLIKSPYLWTSKLKHLKLFNFPPLVDQAVLNDLLPTLEASNIQLEMVHCGKVFTSFEPLDLPKDLPL